MQCDLYRGDAYTNNSNRASWPDQCDAPVLESDRGAILDRSSAYCPSNLRVLLVALGLGEAIHAVLIPGCGFRVD